MKGKKNIIKKISLSNKKLFINYKKEVKYILKKKNFKKKKFNFLLLIFYSIKNILKTERYFKLNMYKTKNKFIINNNFYFNYITNGLDLKYDSQIIQNLSINTIYISNYLKKKSFNSKFDDLFINKFQKFITIIDNKYINNFKIEDFSNDYFNFLSYIAMSIFLELYKNHIYIHIKN